MGQIRVDPDVASKVKFAAVVMGVSESTVVAKAVLAFLADQWPLERPVGLADEPGEAPHQPTT